MSTDVTGKALMKIDKRLGVDLSHLRRARVEPDATARLRIYDHAAEERATSPDVTNVEAAMNQP